MYLCLCKLRDFSVLKNQILKELLNQWGNFCVVSKAVKLKITGRFLWTRLSQTNHLVHLTLMNILINAKFT